MKISKIKVQNYRSIKDKILSDLNKYCALDTFAMVRILEELHKTLDAQIHQRNWQQK